MKQRTNKTIHFIAHSKWSLLMLKITHIFTLVKDKDPKVKVGDYVTISKYKNIFTKGYSWDLYLKYLWIKIL